MTLSRGEGSPPGAFVLCVFPVFVRRYWAFISSGCALTLFFQAFLEGFQGNRRLLVGSCRGIVFVLVDREVCPGTFSPSPKRRKKLNRKALLLLKLSCN